MPRRRIFLICVLATPGLTLAQSDLLDLYSAVEAADKELTPRLASPSAMRNKVAEVVQAVTVNISGVRNDDGSLRVLLFDEADAYSQLDPQAAVGYTEIKASELGDSVKVDAYTQGPYAVFAFHDENNNREFDMQGARPREAYGYSGSIDPFLPPPFERAAIVHDSGSVRLQYLPSRMRR